MLSPRKYKYLSIRSESDVIENNVVCTFQLQCPTLVASLASSRQKLIRPKTAIRFCLSQTRANGQTILAAAYLSSLASAARRAPRRSAPSPRFLSYIFAAACLSARRRLLGAIPAEPLNRKGHKGCNCRGELEPIFRSGLTQTGSKATSNWIGACKSKVKPKVLESVV